MTGCPLLDSEYAARQNGKRLPCERMLDENAKQHEWMREAVRFMGCVTECDAGAWAVWMDELAKKARELGVDA